MTLIEEIETFGPITDATNEAFALDMGWVCDGRWVNPQTGMREILPRFLWSLDAAHSAVPDQWALATAIRYRNTPGRVWQVSLYHPDDALYAIGNGISLARAICSAAWHAVQGDVEPMQELMGA